LTPNPSVSGSRKEAHRDEDGAERCGERVGGSHVERTDGSRTGHTRIAPKRVRKRLGGRRGKWQICEVSPFRDLGAKDRSGETDTV